MRRTAAALIISLLLAAIFPVHALELETGIIRPFADNILTVTSEDGGLLTIEAINGTVPLENPVTEMRVEGGLQTVRHVAVADIPPIDEIVFQGTVSAGQVGCPHKAGHPADGSVVGYGQQFFRRLPA